jgi:sortase A
VIEVNYYSTKYKKNALYILFFVGLSMATSAFWVPLKAQLAQYLLKKSWDEMLVTQAPVKPWPWFDYLPVAELISEKHQLRQIVLSGDEGAALAFGPGENSTTRALSGAATVISGHRDTHFEFLEHVDIGEVFLLKRLSGIEEYKVKSIEVVDSSRVEIDPTNKPDALLLVTCYPFNERHPLSSLRYVVIADRINEQDLSFKLI